MSPLKTHLQLYRECGAKAFSALPRSAPAVLALVVYATFLSAVGQLLAPAGFAGGLLVGLAHAACVGSYLHMVQEVVQHRRGRVRFSDIQDTVGVYLWDVISVLFIFWIVGFFLSFTGPLALIWYLAASICFNPAPELIYAGRSRSVELLKDAWRFVARHPLGWFAPNVALLALLGSLLPGFGGVWLFQATGPFFGFIDLGSLLLLGLTIDHLTSPDLHVLLAVSRMLGGLVVVHWLMLFRGLLFLELSTKSTRSRAWKALLARDDTDEP